jgi:hypothetical protein
MSISFYCTKHYLSKRSGSLFVFIKQNMDVNFQPPSLKLV